MGAAIRVNKLPQPCQTCSGIKIHQQWVEHRYQDSQVL